MAMKDEVALIRKRMEKAIDDIRQELASIRTGRASISILDNIQVDYYGTPTPINQVAQLGTPDPTLVTVQPYDVSLVGPIEKAIRASDLDRKSTRLNSSHGYISYAVFCLKKKNKC